MCLKGQPSFFHGFRKIKIIRIRPAQIVAGHILKSEMDGGTKAGIGLKQISEAHPVFFENGSVFFENIGSVVS